MAIDWTLRTYEGLCSAVIATGRPVLPVCDFLKTPESNALILRHDVDRFPDNAVRMAELEARLGICSTYYVRISRKGPDSAFLERIRTLGHEVGYHYEVLAKSHGDIDSAMELFRHELSQLRSHVPIETIAPHGSPLSRWDSLRIWDNAERRDFGVSGDAYLDIDFSTAIYFTDTGRTWGGTASNLRDHPVTGGASGHTVRTTAELIAVLPHLGAQPLCIQTHPERWNSTVPRFMRSWLLDLGSNGVKRVIRIMRPQQTRFRDTPRR